MRFAAFVLLFGLPLASATRPGADAGDAGPGASASVDCPHAAGPGRVRCEVEVKPPGGAVLKWADAQVLATPAFASALRARVGPADASIREEAAWRWTMALAARGRGAGSIEVRVRIVSCVHDVCTPSEVVVTGPLVVGE